MINTNYFNGRKKTMLNYFNFFLPLNKKQSVSYTDNFFEDLKNLALDSTISISRIHKNIFEELFLKRKTNIIFKDYFRHQISLLTGFYSSPFVVLNLIKLIYINYGEEEFLKFINYYNDLKISDLKTHDCLKFYLENFNKFNKNDLIIFNGFSSNIKNISHDFVKDNEDILCKIISNTTLFSLVFYCKLIKKHINANKEIFCLNI